MKVIEPSVEQWKQESGINGMYEIIQKAAFVCYQTEKAKTKPKEFVQQLLNNGHLRPLEVGSCYLTIPETFDNLLIIKKYRDNPYSRVISVDGDPNVYITTNFRVIMQGSSISDKAAKLCGYKNNWLNDLQRFWSNPTQYHEIRYTFSMIMSRGCTDDFRTHITLTSLCESTRWCLYMNKKFGNQLTFIRPYFLKQFDGKDITPTKALAGKVLETLVYGHFLFTEKIYNLMSKIKGFQAQYGKRILPLDIKAQLVLCGYKDAWDNFIYKRTDEHADPECQLIANKIKSYL